MTRKMLACFGTAVAIIMTGSLILGSGVLLSGCKGEKEKKIASVRLEGLDIYYLPTDYIDFDSVTLDVTYDDGTETVLTDKVFDVAADSAEGAEFILYTDGLYDAVSSGRELEKRDYEISCKIPPSDKKYDLMTLTVGSDYLADLNVLSYGEPDFVSEYRYNLSERTDGEAESSFYHGTEGYFIGDDNGFLFKPEVLAENRTTGEIGTFSSFPSETKVTLVYGDLNASGDALDLTENDYVSCDGFVFDFTEKAVGKTFTIETVPEGGIDANGEEIRPVSFDVTVADGWNVTTALDLGKINLVGDGFNRNDYVNGDDEKSANAGGPLDLFWDEGTESLTGKYTTDIWEEFLKEKGYSDLSPANGIFLHGDITITQGDIPADYFVSESEARHFGCRYDDMIGSVRDMARIYEKNIEEDFLFDGNLFTIDASQLKWAMTHFNTEYEMDYYPENFSGTYRGSSIVLFAFQGKTSSGTEASDRAVATVRDVFVVGNAIDQEDTEGKQAGSMSFCESRCSVTKFDNCIVREFLYGLRALNSNDTYVNLDILHTKVYDCYHSGIMTARSARNEVRESVLKRFSGPVVSAICAEDEPTWGDHYYYMSGISVDSDTVMENFLSGSEGWFVSSGATEIAVYIKMADAIFRACTDKTVLNEDGKIALDYMVQSSGTLGDGGVRLNCSYVRGDDSVPFVLNEDTSLEDTDGVASDELMADTGAYNAAVTNYFVDGIAMDAIFPLPITFSTDRGTIFALDAGMTGFYDPVALRNNGYAALPGEEVGLTEEDSQVYVYYRMGSVGIGLVVSLFDIE